MPGRSFLKWTTLVTVSIVVLLTWLSFAQLRTAHAKDDDPKPPTQGSLQALDAQGNPARDCPLTHTSVKAQISGFISRVTVTQDFENNFTNKIEAVYTFPLPQAAAVDDMTMQIGERIIKGKIMRRQEAQAVYTAAKEAGQTASLLDQERPNIFTQQVANIMPGQQIRITISYVETLKYEDGAYEWSFPMVVGERYNPVKNNTSQHHASFTPRNTAYHARDGKRSGHDISLELDLDTGVPIVGVNSGSHETEVQQLNERRALVRLKDRATIPNKDFVLTYRVAGDTINDAVLTHRSERGGFFTLILQPPQRVAPEDVMPKELVFVLDTSGSMHGFPLAKARQTMDLALDNLYPHDTFNIITFAGDTEILFPDPVPATPDNLRKAKTFLESRRSDGGTEMMSAIKAALDPSDSQQHVRIVCFMTDGLVGNDLEIIAEVKKHPNARVFAMGFSDSPNRFLLDEIAEQGQGDVEYVQNGSDASAAVRRFHNRIRNPLLHDLSIDWSNLPVGDVYPKRIPDLFSAKPVVVSGRYVGGAEGTIKLKGRMAGHDFVREIKVTLPQTEAEHDVLATLWARRKVGDLMDQELVTVDENNLREQLREEITNLGLEFKLMTQYTSFVAVDELSSTGPEEPEQIEVPRALTETVTVTAYSANVDYSVYGATPVRVAKELPLQGRSLQSLLYLAPGVVGNQNTVPRSTFSVNGQRSTSNQFSIDGVSANFGIAAGGENPGPSASGNTPALTASGGTNGIAPFGATQEMNVQPSGPESDRGRVSGAQVNLITRSGTNAFHGAAFYAFGNDAFDASDWFANSRNLAQPPKRLNMFSASLGGPVIRDRTFFFASYEGMRLRQPVVGVTDVPSLASRAAASAGLRSFFDSFPLPTGAPRADGFAEFAAGFANPARHDLGSIRVDQVFGPNTNVRGRYTFTDSDASQRGANAFSLNTVNRVHSRAETFTGTLNQTLSATLILELHANYSRSKVSGSYLLDEFGGAAIPVFPATAFAFDLNSRNARLMTGEEASSTQRQFNLVASAARVEGNHTFKFGGDFRRLSPILGQRATEEKVLFENVAQALTGVAARFSHVSHATPQNPVFTNLSLFAQDEWRKSNRLKVVYGLRWELAPAPSSNELQPAAVDQISDPTQLKLAAAGTSLWKTTFANFAPRAGFAYQLLDPDKHELVLRADVGIAYDLGQDRSGDAFANSIPFISGTSVFDSPFPSQLSPAANVLPLMAFDPQLKLPYAINWSVSLQKPIGSRPSLSAAYVGSSGRRLLHTETLFNQNADFAFLRLVSNRGSSDYRALQVKYDHPFTDGFEALVSYTLSRTFDNVSDDSVSRVTMASANPAFDRGPSDLDVRHQLTGHVLYELPAPFASGLGNTLFRNWAVDSIFNTRSAKPLNVFYMFPTSVGVAYQRADVVNGVSAFVVDPNAAGGRRLNPAAFLSRADFQHGNLSRNRLRGFPFYQFDLAMRRKFSFSENVWLHFQADVFNLFNHTNFDDPSGTDLVVGNNLAFGESNSLSGRSASAGGFASFYSFGGPRTLRFSLKLEF